MRWIAILLLTQLAVFGQPAKPEELSVVEGRVLNSTTGDPLAKAALTLSRTDQKSEQANWEQSYAVTSDATGKFLIRNIRPGLYRLAAKRTGFLDAEYGAHLSQQTGTVLDLTRPQQMKDLELRLSPQGVISGRILDADGEPMFRAAVHLLRSRYASGRKVIVAMNVFGSSNDLGEYRFPGLPPGKYYVFAEAGKFATPLSELHEEYVPAYYPGSVDFAGAGSIDILPGSQIRAGDLLLHKEHTVTVRGRVVVNVPAIDRVMPVYITRDTGFETSGSGWQSIVATVNSSGEFEAHGVTPGSYTAGVSVSKKGGGYYGSAKLNVGGSDVENVVITVDPGLTVTGGIVVEGQTKEPLNALRIRFLRGRIAPYNTMSLGDDPVAKDQTFRISGMSPDVYSIEVLNLPDGFYTKRIRAGSLDVTYTGLDLRSGGNDPIEVLLSAKAGVISGVVQNPDKNETAPGATVALVPKEAERLTIPQYFPAATTDQYGRFTLKNVPPGDYKAYAWEDIEPTAWMDPEFMALLSDKGLPVTVAESGQLNVQVPLIAAR